jgi:tripartite ATP-independent transporter DctM subunit
MGGFEWLALAMFGGFMILLLLGYPVAFSFAGAAIVFGLIGYSLDLVNPNRLWLLSNLWFGTMSNFTLLAVPYFVFLGAVFEKTGMAEELLSTVGVALGPLRGGMALAVILVGTLLAATTGVVAATVIVMGMLTMPIMLRYGYDKRLASGVIIATGTLAQVIPPSIVLVVLADQLGVSVGDLFIGSVIPGLMLSGSFALYVIVLAFFRPHMAPALPREIREAEGKGLGKRIIKAVVPPVFLIFAVLGSIFFGVATPTEAGAVGALGATVLAAIYGKLNWKLLKDAAHSTVNITALVIMILIAASLFTIVFDALGGKRIINEFLINLPGGVVTFLIVSNIAIFFLGMFLEFIEIAFLIIPLFVPAAIALGVDMVWFGVILGLNLQIAFISPPVGFSLFYLQSVAPKEVSTGQIHRSAFPFMALQALVLILVALFPQTVTWLIEISFG